MRPRRIGTPSANVPSEILEIASEEPRQHDRSGDAVNALWGMLDMTPEGRGEFVPKLAY